MIYFDNAATSRYKPRCVIKEIEHGLLCSANSGRSAHSDAVEAALKNERTRSALCSALGAKNHTAILTKNCTEALNLAILGGGWSGSIVTTPFEHNSSLRALYRLNSLNKTEILFAKGNEIGVITPDSFAAAIRKDTSLACVNAASNVNGSAPDIYAIADICTKRNIPLLIDCAQAVPHVKIDASAMNVAFLAMPGHKGLHGVQGTGALLVQNKYRLTPLIYGGTGTASSSVFQPTGYPEALESGTLFNAGFAALGVAVEWTYRNADKINKHVQNLANELLYGLNDLHTKTYTTDTRCGIVSFNIGELPSTYVADILNEEGYAVRAGLHCAPLAHRHAGTLKQGSVRFSVGYNNTRLEVNKALSALERIVAQNR